jgi:hypothetical protein
MIREGRSEIVKPLRMRKVAFFTALLLAMSPNAHALEVPLQCADSEDLSLRTVMVWEGCAANELPLGTSSIATPQDPVEGIHPYLLTRFRVAQAAAKSEGVNIYIASGYRSLARQKYLFAEAIKKYGSATAAARWVLPPDISRHPMGLALDINYPSQRAGAKWLEINGYKYGLVASIKMNGGILKRRLLLERSVLS